MRIFGGERILGIMERLKVDDDTPIENRMISRSLEAAQKKVEGFNFDQRKNVVQYDDVMNRHRKAIYVMRREILKQNDISPRIKRFISDEIQALSRSPQAASTDFEKVVTEIFPFDEKALDIIFESDVQAFGKALEQKALELYESREVAFTTEIMHKIERDVYLQILDNLWMQHLENMDHMREGIHWISVGQRDPLVEYRRQSQILFEQMQNTLRYEVVKTLYNVQPVSEDKLDAPAETELTRAARQSIDNADRIIEADEFHEQDFAATPVSAKNTLPSSKKTVAKGKRKKAHKAERKRRAKGRRH